ncbi:cellulose biosynthesis protein BcsS [Burkholderia thailandensis]|uniref:cellulose biosynthesis protein BcsS n=1 Tax=Burkholderia thailandensis TaxID=57975 RepID=UPI0009B66E0A|nr:cellulose biosynthesis protein BcsS [Burkholderia thailandensis]AVR29010.1 cellulose biosynthesis protein BcsS [Burkholderia thailandensis]MCS3392482.1 cellulose biosynthesis protein BcsS [Burkholderia thailandensis]MCS6425237.1 cellulose biosynthesis protein BcsS [Burkholderia thailandensis]MCS6453769.1 cellulose biosynthesis protein BcsS [Burkholderia thailandensis]MCS6464797.1 cellulose biosynthesis protein BcsS [Burkholderia thailandensis]
MRNDVSKKMKISRRPLFIAIFAIISHTAAAGEPLMFGGASIGEQGERYEYLGGVTPFLSSRYLVDRLAVGDYYYRYGANGDTVHVRGQSVEFALGAQAAWQSGWAELSTGGRYRHNRVSPQGANARADGSQFGLVVGVQAQHQFGRDWALHGIANYTFGPAAYWGRLRFLHRVFGVAWAGVEVIRHGDPDYHATQGGVALTGLSLGGGFTIGGFAGVNKTKGQPHSIYGGVELIKQF